MSAHEALSAFLGRAYAAQFLRREPVETVTADFRAAMGEDPELAEAAKAEATRLQPIADNRCAISKAHKSFLRTALSES